ncbi:MAG: PKD domain-containing protein [Thermoplasmatota archaeon]|jgi:hypothetical protein
MRKNIITMSITGMLLLSSFITVSAASGDYIIEITIGNITPVNGSIEIPIDQKNVSVYVEAEKIYSESIFPEYVNFLWEIGGKNITKSNGENHDGYGTIVANISGPLYTNTNITWYVNVTVIDEDVIYYRNETFWFVTYNELPVADFSNTTHGLKVDFDGTLSYDVDGAIVNYTWYFGDGSEGYGNKTQHIFGYNGTYFVSLNVTDDGGKSDNKTVPVTVKGVTDTIPPTIQIIQPERAFYMGNKKIRRFFFRIAFVIGSITVEVNASDSGSGVSKVEFYINNKLVNTSYKPNEDGLYTYKWTKDRIRLIHLFKISVVAYDRYNNTASDSILVKKFL